MRQLIIRHRQHGANLAHPPFSARDYRALSVMAPSGGPVPEGFSDTTVPITGATIAQTVYLSGVVEPPALCSGLGRCGFCRVLFLSEAPPALDVEYEALSHHDIDAGWRLGCRHAPQDGMHVLVPALATGPRPALSTARTPRHATPEAARRFFAVDLGTTSVHWETFSPTFSATFSADDATITHGVMVNPQMGAGSDVISRIAHASSPEGARTLRDLALAGLVRASRETADDDCTEACIAANPAMTAILLGKDVSGFARAPYTLAYEGGVTENLPGLPPVWIPPQISPFIGGDVSAGYTALTAGAVEAARQPEFPFLLADLGTNGECVLALSPDTALAASLPMGPALEGINLTFGSDARPGAVTGYTITPYGLEPHVMGETAPTGITATGYLSLLRALRASGLVTEDGLFAMPGSGSGSALGRRMGEEDAHAPHEPRIRLPGKMFLAASDVEEILKVKAAFTLAVSSLLREASLSPSQLGAVYLAGSLGSHAPLDALSALGFLPPGLRAPVIAVGNTSLAGAKLFLRDTTARETAVAWAKRVSTLDLASDPAFGAAYAEHMRFAWKG